MLRIYTRHDEDCAHYADSNHRRCRCPKWIRGVLPNQGAIRKSARSRSWEQAERYARQLEQRDIGAALNDTKPAPPIEEKPAGASAAEEKTEDTSIREATELFLADQQARNLSAETTRKYRGLLERQFLVWAKRESVTHLVSLRPLHLTKFRSTWLNGGSTIFRKHEMMNSFLDFCVMQQFLKANPMKGLKKPKMPEVTPTDYFRPEEFEKIVAATDRYTYGGGNDCKERARRLRALTLLMRWSGLGILDAVTLERNRLSKSVEGDDQIFLYRTKTKVPVYVVIPADVAELLRQLPNSNPKYFFWSGNGDPRSARKGYERSYWKLFKLADIRGEDGNPKRCHPHMFRDTFAVELLLAGNPMDQVSLLLGHSSVKITEKHYAPFCKARQLQLTSAVKKAWLGLKTWSGMGNKGGGAAGPTLLQ